MGNATTRITAPEFVTPPELADYQLAANGAGRIGGLRLELSGRPTRLTASYQQVPLRVLSLDFGSAQPRLVYLLNPTAGLFDGDAQLVEVNVGPDSRVFITGQSATRIHPCVHGFSTQQWRLRVAAGAIVVILPGPAIPFQGCRYYQRAEVDLAEGSHLIWGDLWLPGRYARGADSERFKFQVLTQDFTVRQAGRMVFRDRFCWQGPWDRATAAWHFGDANAYGTLFSTYSNEVWSDPLSPRTRGERAGVRGDSIPCENMALLHATSAPSPLPLSPAYGAEGKLRLASFQTAVNHTCLRWLGSVQAVTAALTRSALTLAALAEGRSEPWLLAGHDLAPNHWFSS